MSLLPIPQSDSKCGSARLDLLSLVINSPDTIPATCESLRDSLSPLDPDPKDDFAQRDRGKSGRAVELSRWYEPQGRNAEAGTRGVQTKHELDPACHEFKDKHEATTSEASATACSPRCSSLTRRERRPSVLNLTRTNGLTSLAIDELKFQICHGHTDTCTTITQHVSQRTSSGPQHSQSPKMGNQSSSVSGSPAADDASTHSVVRKPVRLLRKTSHNLFKRVDSRSPLSKELTTNTVLQVTQQVSQSTFDDQNDREIDDSTINSFHDSNALSAKSPLPRNMPPEIHSASTITITEESAVRPLSASATIRELKGHSRRGSRVETRTSFVEDLDEVIEERSRCATAPPLHRSLTLSPSIPAPSPLPEDSPHKYGLKDRMDTPDLPEPDKIEVVKARRKSTGLDIFNEAKSLQSASSFLNGLSSSRRRAKSTQRSTETSGWTHATYDTTRPSSSRVPSRPSSSRQKSTTPTTTYSSERRYGHTFKPSGFAYTRALTLAQVKCYRSHQRLLPSRNKLDPVECSVCHIDDDQEHFACSWCALRMCRFCKRDFAERGLTALKERIKQAEIGDGSSPTSSTDSLGGTDGRGRKMFD